MTTSGARRWCSPPSFKLAKKPIAGVAENA